VGWTPRQLGSIVVSLSSTTSMLSALEDRLGLEAWRVHLNAAWLGLCVDAGFHCPDFGGGLGLSASFPLFLSCTSDPSWCNLVHLAFMHRGGSGVWLIWSSPLCIVYCESRLLWRGLALSRWLYVASLFCDNRYAYWYLFCCGYHLLWQICTGIFVRLVTVWLRL